MRCLIFLYHYVYLLLFAIIMTASLYQDAVLLYNELNIQPGRYVMNKTLSISEWHQLAQEGTKLPVRIPLSGWSMDPLIRGNRDLVTITPMETMPQIGDIVLFADPYKDRYVMHRVWALKDQEILTWGDNCPRPDGWLPIDAVWGKAVRIERGNRIIETNAAKGMAWARFWHQAGKVYRPYIRYKYALKSRIENMKAWVKK